MYFDELRQDPAALGAIVTPERDNDRLGPPGPGHYLHGHATINDWSPMPETPTPSYESQHRSDTSHGAAPHEDDGWWVDRQDGPKKGGLTAGRAATRTAPGVRATITTALPPKVGLRRGKRR